MHLVSHCWKLEGWASVNNAADTCHFVKNKSLMFHFLSVSEVVEDDVGQLKSCTLHCGVCRQGKWHWSRGGKAKGSTSNMNIHMQEKHDTLWQAANQAD